MKRGTMLPLLLITSSALTFGQIPPNMIQIPTTRLEAFAAKKGTLLATETYYLPGPSGEGCRIRLQALILYEAERESSRIQGLRVEVDGGVVKNAPGVVSYVDVEELAGLANAIGVMLEMTRKGTSLANPIARQLSFSTIGGLTLTVTQQGYGKSFRSHKSFLGKQHVCHEKGDVDC
jgi:hypothetical protein